MSIMDAGKQYIIKQAKSGINRPELSFRLHRITPPVGDLKSLDTRAWRLVQESLCHMPYDSIRYVFKKYKTFSVLIYCYINTSGNWKNEKLCGNTTPAGRSVFTQFPVFPVFLELNLSQVHFKCPCPMMIGSGGLRV